uniref:ATP synthase subunit a n=1 Tax=Planopleura kaempferi TaxID=3381683 RepID=A0A344ALW0_9HEMI|nr:ATP synthase F0 subunit 6 [Platypleura kaempferi]AWV84476.1 ATP synthase F0 subunit 6 [Platypleura kaempferi]
MMTNLFSSFDPSTGILSMNWCSSIISLMLYPMMFWFIPNRYFMMMMKINLNLNKEMTLLLSTKVSGSTLIFLSLFLFIFFNNFVGLMPYVFTCSSHMVYTMTLALPLWLSFMIYGWFNNTNHMFVHLVPMGTPNILMPFMVCIETISNLIRPGSLAVRLTANMIAGHLLMTLLGNSSINSGMYVNMIFIIQILLVMFEFAVSIIQSYVFTILSTLYSSEVL